MSKRSKVRPVTRETREEYLKSETNYFGAIGGGHAQDRGASATDVAHADQHLPSRELQFKMEERLEKGFNKASRSGAFSKASTGFAIRPSGGKFASDFVDEMTPGKYKQQEERPVPREQTRAVDAPKAEVVLTDFCLDCMTPIDPNNAGELVCGMTMVCNEDPIKHFCMGVRWQDAVLFVVHKKCFEAAKKMGKNNIRLALVKGGSLTDEKDVAIAMKYNLPINLHDGQEITVGQWELTLRKERMELQLEDYLIHSDKSSMIYRRNREAAEQK